jgi:hypothetical protein
VGCRDGETNAGRRATMRAKMKEGLIPVLSAIFGVVVGAVSNGLMNAHIQDQQRRSQAVFETFRSEYGNFPVEYLRMKQLIDQSRDLSVMSSGALRKLADVHRRYPGCTDVLSEACKPGWVAFVQIMREELGSGYVSADDIEVSLRDKYQAAERALENIRKQGRDR